jgi:hypothetical protein
MARVLLAIALLLGVVALHGVAAASVTGEGRVVLGKKGLLPHGIGWGTAHPRLVFNGGDPSGRAFRLRWTGWGSAVAHARGRTWVPRPKGGYYAKPGVILMRAYALGRCRPKGPPAYTRLMIRVAVRPGGRLGAWFRWGGWRSLCVGP